MSEEYIEAVRDNLVYAYASGMLDAMEDPPKSKEEALERGDEYVNELIEEVS